MRDGVSSGSPSSASSNGQPTPRYKRVLVKLSGEVLQGEKGFGIDSATLRSIATQLKDVHEHGVELAVVIGGGNIFRGLSATEEGYDRVTGDHMGMLATLINGLAFSNAMEHLGVQTRVMSAIEVNQVAEPYIRRRAMRHLEKGRVLVFAGGTGNPFFTTDSAAALRAAEIDADVVLKATKVDGIYTDDPMKNAEAELLPRITFHEVLTRGLRVMDGTAIAMCEENRMPIVVFDIKGAGNILRIVLGQDVGSLVTNE